MMSVHSSSIPHSSSVHHGSPMPAAGSGVRKRVSGAMVGALVAGGLDVKVK